MQMCPYIFVCVCVRSVRVSHMVDSTEVVQIAVPSQKRYLKRKEKLLNLQTFLYIMVCSNLIQGNSKYIVK